MYGLKALSPPRIGQNTVNLGSSGNKETNSFRGFQLVKTTTYNRGPAFKSLCIHWKCLVIQGWESCALRRSPTWSSKQNGSSNTEVKIWLSAEDLGLSSAASKECLHFSLKRYGKNALPTNSRPYNEVSWRRHSLLKAVSTNSAEKHVRQRSVPILYASTTKALPEKLCNQDLPFFGFRKTLTTK